MFELKLHRDPLGRLSFTTKDGEVHNGVIAVRAFPISDPSSGVSLLSARGHELLWIPSLSELSRADCELIAEELGSREFTPVITRIREVSSFSAPCSWEVDTDRGATTMVLKSQDDIRRLTQSTLLITDKRGIQFLLRDPHTLDKRSRRLLDRFL